MKAAIIENGVVTNIAMVADEAFAQAQGWVVSDMAKIGDEYDAASGTFTTHVPVVTLEEAKASATQRINAGYSAELAHILADYPDAETKTWDKQESEARAWQADNTASTPLLDKIATARSMDKAELVNRIITKADSWISSSGSATGKRQMLEDQIAAATTVDEANAIGW